MSPLQQIIWQRTLHDNFRLNWTRLQRACQRHWTSHSDSLVHNFNFLLVLLCIRLTSHQHTAVQLVKLTCHHCNFAHYPLSPLKQPSTVMLQPVNSCFTVLRTRLKYTKLTATAMVCSRIAASKTSPRLWRDRETAISFHSAAPKRKFRGARDASSGEDKSDQAPLQPCSARVGGGRGGREDEWTASRRRRCYSEVSRERTVASATPWGFQVPSEMRKPFVRR